MGRREWKAGDCVKHLLCLWTMVGKKKMNSFEEGNPRSVYCCWQEGGKMSDTLGNTPRHINISATVRGDQGGH